MGIVLTLSLRAPIGKFITAGILFGIIAWLIITNLPPNQSAIQNEFQTIVNKSDIKPYVQHVSVELDDMEKTYFVTFKFQLKDRFMKLAIKKQYDDMVHVSRAVATIKQPACSKCNYYEIDAENGDTLFKIDVADDDSNNLFIYDQSDLLKDPDLVWRGNLDRDKNQTTADDTTKNTFDSQDPPIMKNCDDQKGKPTILKDPSCYDEYDKEYAKHGYKSGSTADYIEENGIPYEDNYWINGKGFPPDWGSRH